MSFSFSSLLSAIGSRGSAGALALMNSSAPQAGVRRHEDVEYAPGRLLDVYAPQRRGENGHRPVLVFFHGGRWSFSDKQDYPFLGAAFASRGITTVVVGYRLYPEGRYDDFMRDGADAVAWIREHIARFGGDADDLFLMGHSAGAHIAALLALDGRHLARVGGGEHWLRGMIGVAGPYDLRPIVDTDLLDIFGPEEAHAESQPMTHAAGRSFPFLFVHGWTDTTVGRHNTRRLANAIRREGGEAESVYYQTGHLGILAAFSRPFGFVAPVIDEIIDFIERRHSAA